MCSKLCNNHKAAAKGSPEAPRAPWHYGTEGCPQLGPQYAERRSPLIRATKKISVHFQKQQRSGVQLSERLASLGIMWAQLRASLKPPVHYSTIILRKGKHTGGKGLRKGRRSPLIRATKKIPARDGTCCLRGAEELRNGWNFFLPRFGEAGASRGVGGVVQGPLRPLNALFLL